MTWNTGNFVPKLGSKKAFSNYIENAQLSLIYIPLELWRELEFWSYVKCKNSCLRIPGEMKYEGSVINSALRIGNSFGKFTYTHRGD